MSYFATAYTIHFDDTMAYGSHHFLTGFKFQCAAREALLYGDLIFDKPGVPEALDQIHLFTADAYSRNLRPTFLGDRVAILITLEEWGRVSARFCYRVLNRDGAPICAGFQNMICADARSGAPVPLPAALRDAFDAIRMIEEPESKISFRDDVLKSVEATESLFTDRIRNDARTYLTDRYPSPRLIGTHVSSQRAKDATSAETLPKTADAVEPAEVWVFPGQGAFDPRLLSLRVASADVQSQTQLALVSQVVAEHLGGDVDGLLSGCADRCHAAVNQTPDMSQVAIHLQSVLGAWQRWKTHSPSLLLGHSFGEIAALNVAGCFDLPTAVQIVCQRIAAIRQHAPREGGLMVISTTRRAVSEEIAVGGFSDVVIAGRNHEGQTVASGPKQQLDALRRQLQVQQVQAISIAAPTCFHHPLLREAAHAWRTELSKLPISPPRIPVFSPIGRRLLTAKDNIASVLASQFLRPFDLQGAVEDLHTGGFDQFVDCGSGGSLARLLDVAGSSHLQITNVATTELTTIGPPSFPTSSPPTRAATPSLQSSWKRNEPTARADRPRVAVVGQGCLLPGRVTSPESLHAAIMEQRLGIIDQRDLDPEWDQDFFSAELTADASTSGLAGRVDDRDLVAPAGVDPKLFATFSRPQQLLCHALAPCTDALVDSGRLLCFLGTTADGFRDQDEMAALRQAGVDGFDPTIADCLGTKVAAGVDPYQAIQQVLHAMVGSDASIRLIDAACASSLYAVALGMYALENDKADVILAGGLFCPGPGNNCLFSQFGGLTATGCRPFDAEADGVAFAEGAAVVVLKRLEEARRMGNSIVSVVRGVGLSSDGRSPSANVPQSAGQTFALKRCYDAYQIEPDSVGAIEGHGTSTPVGDATEIRTLANFFAGHVTRPVPIHSIKGLLGHTGWAAGTASLIAANEAIRHEVFPAQAFFREPTEALTEASATLRVPRTPEPLPAQHPRIAIDGFGFGGSNAHLVVEPAEFSADTSRRDPTPTTSEDEEAVVVAWHEILPRDHQRFDRHAVKPPAAAVLLPDLVDDMDITQTLMLSLADGLFAKLDGKAEALRAHTGIVLALEGKTERAVEATTRILGPRLTRRLAGTQAAQRVAAAREHARPSGPYTLQCMMPNVSAGRTALAFDLHGPNFVVDAGVDSAEAAFASAELLLGSGGAGGAELLVVAGIGANRWPVPHTSAASASREFAVAFAVTTRRRARELKLDALAPVHSLLSDVNAEAPTEAKFTHCVKTMNGESPAADSTRLHDDFPIHRPVWVEVPAATVEPVAVDDRCVVITRAENKTLIDELLRLLPTRCRDYRLLAVGSRGASAALPRTIHLDPESEDQDAVIAQLEAFAPQLVVAVDKPMDWMLEPVLANIHDNRLCEAMFMVMQALHARLESRQTEFWGLFPGAWDGRIHPVTGAISGLIKSSQREFPHARLGVVSTRDLSVSQSWQSLHQERAQPERAEAEVVIDGTTRRVRRLRAIDLDQTSSVPNAAVPLQSDSVVIATGGARGVTAVLLDALLSDHQCTVIALGRSPLETGPPDFDSPEVEQAYYEQCLATHSGSPATMRKQFQAARARWEAEANIRRLAQLGGRIRYVPVDVTCGDEIDRVVQEVVAEYGRIDLIIHGAGVQWSKKLRDRSLAEFRKTFAVKVGGLQNLARSCRRHLGKTVATHVLTSAYSIFGNDGQHDYGAANETMDRLCGLPLEQPSCQAGWSSIAWSAWNGVGMTRGSEYRNLAEKRNLALLTEDAGKHVFRTVIEGKTHAAINVPLSPSERTRYQVRTLPPQNGRPVQRTLEQSISLANLPCLPFHQARGKETLPGAWIVDFMIRAAMEMHGRPESFFTVESMRFLRFVRVLPGHDAQLRVVVDATPTGYTAWMIGNVLNPDGVTLLSDQVFAKARLRPGSDLTMPRPSLNGMLKNGKGEIRFATDPYCAGAETVDLSGPFNCLPKIEIGPLGRRAEFQPHTTEDWGGVVPSLLLDASLRVAGMHCVPDALHVPTQIDRVTLPVGFSTDSAAAAGWRIRTSDPVAEGDQIRCDRVEVTNRAGELMVLVEGAWVTRLR